MPFGPNCEYADFAACVRANGDKSDPEAYCAKIMRETEDHCKGGDNVSHRLLRSHQVLNLHAGQKGWYRIKNASGQKDAPAEIYIYGYIGWDVTANEFLRELSAITAGAIDVHIATNGGAVDDGIAILNALRAHRAEVTTIVDSQALSAGSFIFQAGDMRKMMPNTSMMIHDASIGGGWAEGNSADLREFAKEIVKLADHLDASSDNIASIYADRAGGTAEHWRAIMLEETWYTAQQAVDAGLADEVMDLSARNIGPAVTAQAPMVPVQPAPPEPPAVENDGFDLDWAALAQSIKEAPRA